MLSLVIYILIDPTTNEIRWVGLTNNIKKRYSQHCMAKSTNKHLNNWINKLKEKNLTPDYLVIDKANDLENINKLEIFWIKHFREIGCDLINLTDGGEGISGFKRPQSQKNQISNSLKGHEVKPETRQKLREAGLKQIHKPWTDERRKKLSITNTGKTHSLETRLKISHNRKGIKHTNKPGRQIEDEFGNTFISITKAAKFYNLAIGTVFNIVKGKTKNPLY